MRRLPKQTRSGSTRFPCQQRGGSGRVLCNDRNTDREASKCEEKNGCQHGRAEPLYFFHHEAIRLSGCRVSGRRGWRSLHPAMVTPYLYTSKRKYMRRVPHILRALNAECVLDKNNNARSYLPADTKSRSFERVFQNLKHLPALVKNTCCR